MPCLAPPDSHPLHHHLTTSTSPSYIDTDTNKSSMALSLTPRIPPAQNTRAMVLSTSSQPPDTVTNEDRTKPNEVLRGLSPLRPRRTPVLVNAPVVSWHLGAPPLRALPSFDSVLSGSSEGSTVRALREGLRALTTDAGSVRSVRSAAVSTEGLLADGGEADVPLLLQGEGRQTPGWHEDVPFLRRREDLHPPTPLAVAPIPPPHRVPPTLSIAEAEVEHEEEASPSSPSQEQEEDGEDDHVNGWNPHVLSPVTEITEPALSRGASTMSMLSLGHALEIGVARRVRFAAVGNVVGRGVEEEEERRRWSEGQLQRQQPEGRIIRRRPAFYTASRVEGEEGQRSHQDGVALPREWQTTAGCRLHAAGPRLTSPAGARSDVLRTAAAGQTANGETANEKLLKEEKGEAGRRGFCARMGPRRLKEKVGSLRRKLKEKVEKVVAVRMLGRVL